MIRHLMFAQEQKFGGLIVCLGKVGSGSDTWQEDRSRILVAQIIGPEWPLMSSVACYSFPLDLPHRTFMGPRTRIIYLQIA